MSSVKLDRQQLLKTVRAGPPAGLTGHQLGDQLGLDRKQRHRLRSLIAELVDEGVIDKAPGARFRLHAAPPQPSRPPASKAAAASTPALPAGQVAGRLRVHPAGYGFVERD